MKFAGAWHTPPPFYLYFLFSSLYPFLCFFFLVLSKAMAYSSDHSYIKADAVTCFRRSYLDAQGMRGQGPLFFSFFFFLWKIHLYLTMRHRFRLGCS
ncbi:hypothetical protein M406DRAFT_357353 [Cryphonectria parasitica EP155]|uniref:Uncharacterized protein n=1 Tax=Cryphonectria parasitica (strain ATCC 38755 / EP155) TaxID=660469 RepID=A0A9P4XX28_CRYP1|nr:uncharacterized protein M406DRAFT_357353 [Cryphonectria parasitica EP155]KAF3762150.1 hypothetical protein M406DRAFT_357353 [Cryphonectria parasitica EP155]